MSEKIYKCKYCEEDNPENFYKGRKSTCKKCRNKMNNSTFDIKLKEEVFNSITLNENSKILIEKFHSEPQKIFGCKSLKEILQDSNKDINDIKVIVKEYVEKVDKFTENFNELTENCIGYATTIRCLKTENQEIKLEKQEMKNIINELREEKQEMKKEFNELREENRQMKILLQNFLQASK